MLLFLWLFASAYRLSGSCCLIAVEKTNRLQLKRLYFVFHTLQTDNRQNTNPCMHTCKRMGVFIAVWPVYSLTLHLYFAEFVFFLYSWPKIKTNHF